MLEAIRNSSANNLAESKSTVPEGESRCLFGLGVPLGAYQKQGGTDCGFKDAQEDTRDEERAVGSCCTTTGCCNTPEDHIDTKPFSCGDHLEKIN